ncbi:MAG: Glutamate--cysteine ligase [Polyangiaceae bacterium]|jgi:glutamate--cysteine ligase|nr:Glutamate--cysteine ligase [Polyangiaceae bacterium]
MAAHTESTPNDRPIRDLDELSALFSAAEKPVDQFRIGAEAEKFAIHADGSPLPYEGEDGIVGIFDSLSDFGWEPERETPDGPVVSLRRGNASVTLEPGSQLELSGAALPNIHEIDAEFQNHLRELAPISKRLGLHWLGVGFHPLARQEDLTWVPKQRYAIMREYLPAQGHAAHDMMRRTATVQANYDFSSEADAMKKLALSLKLAPIVHAMLANSPLKEGKLAGTKSVRGEVWLHMDPTRSGLIPRIWQTVKPTYKDYVDWALDSGMFLFKREGKVVANTGQTFRAFMKDGYEGHRATVADFKLHLQTLFPEARLKNTLEVRSCDSLPSHLSMAVPALFTGLLYDTRALDQATELLAPLTLEVVNRDRLALVRQGLTAPLGDKRGVDYAQAVYDLASSGLSRRGRRNAQNEDERRYLKPLERLLSKAESPADDVARDITAGTTLSATEIIARCRI